MVSEEVRKKGMLPLERLNQVTFFHQFSLNFKLADTKRLKQNPMRKTLKKKNPGNSLVDPTFSRHSPLSYEKSFELGKVQDSPVQAKQSSLYSFPSPLTFPTATLASCSIKASPLASSILHIPNGSSELRKSSKLSTYSRLEEEEAELSDKVFLPRLVDELSKS